MQRFADLFKKQAETCRAVSAGVPAAGAPAEPAPGGGGGAGWTGGGAGGSGGEAGEGGGSGGDGAETAKSPRSTWLRKAAVLVFVLNYIVRQKPQATTANLTAALTAAVAEVKLQQAFSLQTDWDWLDSSSAKTILLKNPPKNYGKWTTHRGKALLAHPILIGGPLCD